MSQTASLVAECAAAKVSDGLVAVLQQAHDLFQAQQVYVGIAGLLNIIMKAPTTRPDALDTMRVHAVQALTETGIWEQIPESLRREVEEANGGAAA